jgi:phosphatidylglycerol---prolipoprotein diacylglyceryl transferase
MALVFPNFDPVAVSIGPLAIRWYALSYITGILIGWWHVRRIAPAPPQAATAPEIDDLVVWCTFGIVLGGRLGYVLFYQPSHYFAAPLEIFELWHGGMSFHGGALGVILAIAVFAWRHKRSFLRIGDVVVCAVPIGLFFGRIANFVNGELYGRSTELPWGMIFPAHGSEPRHPSQLYEAFLEGVVLFALLFLLRRMGYRERPGFLGGAFLASYGVARFVAEFFRQPDPFMGYLAFGTTEGQLLSIPLLLVGAWLMLRTRKPPPRRMPGR